MSNDTTQQIEFEETLNKLADLAKGRVKFEEFTSVDSVRLLDLFVNNEATLLKMYELIFPQQSFKIKQSLKNPSDMIKLNETSWIGLPFNDSVTEATANVSNSLNHSRNNMAYNQQSTNEAPIYNMDSSLINDSELRQRVQSLQQGQNLHLRFKSSTLPTIPPAMISPNNSEAGIIQKPGRMFEPAKLKMNISP